MIDMRDSPCKDCTKRTADCHSKCKDYKDWRAERDAVQDVINKNRKAERDYWGHRVDYIQKCKKKRFPK